MSLTGATYYPMPWHATSECRADMSPADCEFKLQASREKQCTVKHHTDIINFACMTWNFALHFLQNSTPF